MTQVRIFNASLFTSSLDIPGLHLQRFYQRQSLVHATLSLSILGPETGLSSNPNPKASGPVMEEVGGRALRHCANWA